MLPDEIPAPVSWSLADFLFPAPARRTAGSILGWWERRRVPYNLIVGGTGIFTLAVASIVTLLPPGPHPLGLPPWQAVLAYGILANLCYFLGSTAEIAVERLFKGQVLPTGPALFRMGLTFSVGLTLLPILVILLDWIFRIVTAVVGGG